MKEVKVIFERLKNPIVIMSIASQILIILSMFNVNVDVDLVTKVIVAGCSILVSLGVMNNPAKDTVNTEQLQCEHCGKLANHVIVAGKYVCQECGCVYQGTELNCGSNNKLVK